MTLFDYLKNKFQIRFKNRVFAASIMAGALEDSLKKIRVDKKNDQLLVLGIPRGGVVVADAVASKLPYKCDFDIVIPRKLTAPGNQEIAIGAIMADEKNAVSTYLNDDLIRELDIGVDHIEKEKERQVDEIKRRMTLYRHIENKDYNIRGRIVILADDGAATGATVIAAARWVRKQNPTKLVVVLPVTSKDTAELLKKECDLVVIGTTPSESAFKSVVQYYQDFKPVDDEQVMKIINKYRFNSGNHHK